jgi:hypothetical protein
MKPWRLNKLEGYILEYKVPFLWPMYIGKRRTTFGKAYGIKVRCYWELFALNPSPTPTQKKIAWKVDCPLSKWNVNSGQSTPNSEHNLKKNYPPVLRIFK